MSFHNRGALNKYLRKRGNREPGEAMLQANNLLLSKGTSEASWAIPDFHSFFIGCGFQGCKPPWLNSFVCSFMCNILTAGTAECERLSSVWVAHVDTLIAPFSLANIDFPVQAMFAQGTCQGHPSCPPQRKENHFLDTVALIQGKAYLPAYVIIYPFFSTVLPCMAQHEWNMFDLILIIFFMYLKSQMLRRFTLIKLQLALKLSCINFSSIYREQDRGFKLHTIWGNARDICYCVNCLELHFLSSFWVRHLLSFLLN